MIQEQNEIERLQAHLRHIKMRAADIGDFEDDTFALLLILVAIENIATAALAGR